MLIFVLACSSGDDPAPADEKYRLKEYKYKSGDITTYTYQPDGKLAKVSSLDGSTTYQYDSKGKLINMVVDNPGYYQYYRTSYTYRSNGTTEESLLTYRRIGTSMLEERQLTQYIFTGNLLTETRVSFWDNAKAQWVPSESNTTKYTYDDKGRVTRLAFSSVYWVSAYDEAGNRIDYKGFELKPGSTTEFYMWRHSTYTFDDKKSLYDATHYPYPTTYKAGPNNIVDVVQREFDEKGNTTRTYNFTNVYVYNEQGYPVKQNDDEITFEKY